MFFAIFCDCNDKSRMLNYRQLYAELYKCFKLFLKMSIIFL